jgi:hypothetical protein
MTFDVNGTKNCSLVELPNSRERKGYWPISGQGCRYPGKIANHDKEPSAYVSHKHPFLSFL